MRAPLLVITVLLGACGGDEKPPPAPPSDMSSMPADAAAFIDAHLPGVVLGSVADVSAIASATDWYPLTASTSTFLSTKDQKTTLAHVLTKTSRSPGLPVGSTSGGWSVHLPDKSVQYLRLDADRGLVMPTVVSHSDGLITRLNPPEGLILQNLKEEGESQTIKVRVYDLHEPTVLAHSGSITATWRDLGGWRVKVPLGTYDSRLLHLKAKGTVGPADVDIDRYCFLAEDTGVVAYAMESDITACLLYDSDTVTAGVLQSVDPPR